MNNSSRPPDDDTTFRALEARLEVETQERRHGSRIPILIAVVSLLVSGFNAALYFRAESRSANESLQRKREELRHVLIDADALACSGNANEYTLELHLEAASAVVRELPNEVTCSEFLALASMGDRIWSYEVLSGYCDKAYEKGQTDVQRHLAFLLRGHAAFTHLSLKGPTIDVARENFRRAVSEDTFKADDLKEKSYLFGRTYALWAAHEQYHHHDDVGRDLLQKAESAYAPHPSSVALISRARRDVELARRGISPMAPCPSILGRDPGSISGPEDSGCPDCPQTPRAPTIPPPSIAEPLAALQQSVSQLKEEIDQVKNRDLPAVQRDVRGLFETQKKETPIPAREISPREVLGDLLIRNPVSAEEFIFINGKPFHAKPGTSRISIPYGEVIIHRARFEDPTPIPTDSWKWTGSRYELIFVLQPRRSS